VKIENHPLRANSLVASVYKGTAADIETDNKNGINVHDSVVDQHGVVP
jgi:hypothetical protein